MRDVLAEGALGSAAAARWLNDHVNGARYSPLAVWRFMTKGCQAVDGQRIYLEHAKLGRKFLTSGPALARFAARLAGPAACSVTSLLAPDAKKELENSGFYR
jgi:hypothetical protein